jgi:ankyrin repeat protein
LARGHEAAARYLLDFGAEVNLPDASGNTPVHTAVRLGKIDLVRDLVARGADLKAKTTRSGVQRGPFRSFGFTPFLIAAEAGDVTLMRELVKLGADPKAKSSDGAGGVLLAAQSRKLEAVKLMVELGGDVNEERPGGGTALHIATRFGDNTMIQYLVDHGGDLSKKDRFGRDVLGEAEFEAPKPTIEFVRKLVRNKQ